MSWRDGLNDDQRHAASQVAPLVVVHAGAGSGKTRTLVARARLALEQGALRVLLLTFTRSAAREMLDRIGEGEERATATTIHGLAVQLLRRWGSAVLPAGVSGDSFQVAGDEAKALAADDPARLQRSGLLTYDDVLERAVRGLEAGLDFPRPDLVLVDEAQDLTPVQWRLVRLLGLPRFVVADPCQAIFGWNKADLAEYWREVRTPGAVVCELPRCYRSTPDLVALANSIPAQGRLDLVAANAPLTGRHGVEGDWPSAQAVLDLDIAPAVRAIATRTDDREHPPSRNNVAILARTNDRLREVAAALEDAGIPYDAPSLAGDLWGTDGAQVVLSAVHVAANVHDSLHLAHLLRASKVRESRLARLEALRAGRACSLFDALLHGGSVGAVGHLAQPSVRGGEVPDAARQVLTAMFGWGLDVELQPALERLDLWNKTMPSGADSPSAFLRWYADPYREEPSSGPETDAVHLATVHGAKGLEWPHVVVYGLEQGCFPHARAIRDGGLEEERRLFYVACTRAADSLTLMHYSQRRPWRHAELEAAAPSRFLAEVGMAA